MSRSFLLRNLTRRRAAWLVLLALQLSGCGGGGSASPSPTPMPSPGAAFEGTLLLGAPTMSTVQLKLHAANQTGSVVLAYGPVGGAELQTAPAALLAGQVLSLTLPALSPDTAYQYRVLFTGAGASVATPGPSYRFHTARAVGSSFSFTVQADSHLDENSSLLRYQRTLDNVLADAADFHLDLGDTFMTEKHTEPFDAVVQMAPDAATVNRRYVYERSQFARFSHSVPLFLVNGNHDGELGWLGTSQQEALPIWATQARQTYFANPTPGIFYRGDSTAEPWVGQRASWYAWSWGDALFIVLDPYWASTAQASKDGWNMTLGSRQYQWLTDTLASSNAAYKFVFLHNLVGGLDGQMRGGIEAAPFFEWGGKNADGSEGFAARRPGWAMPIHSLLLKHGVTAVFHGHDHLYAKQSLDAIVYQAVPQPSALNTSSGASLAQAYHYGSGTLLSSAGHLRVTVTPTQVTGEYVRSWLPQEENSTRKNAQIDDRWTVPRR